MNKTLKEQEDEVAKAFTPFIIFDIRVSLFIERVKRFLAKVRLG